MAPPPPLDGCASSCLCRALLAAAAALAAALVAAAAFSAATCTPVAGNADAGLRRARARATATPDPAGTVPSLSGCRPPRWRRLWCAARATWLRFGDPALTTGAEAGRDRTTRVPPTVVVRWFLDVAKHVTMRFVNNSRREAHTTARTAQPAVFLTLCQPAYGLQSCGVPELCPAVLAAP